MPILKPVIADDPFAAVAWDASVAILAFEKLAVREPIRDDERASLASTLEFVRSVSGACGANPEDLVSSQEDVVTASLLASFCSNAEATSSRNEKAANELREAMKDLAHILSSLIENPEMLHEHLLRRGQDACLALLENANLHRPRPEQPPHVHF